ncbi:MAG: winged helix-turn-helix domain-containing protein [Chloroflexi bacterium]|nr:winged helix-turn-helix domain-containing protein [Chloroflexota bacterium]
MDAYVLIRGIDGELRPLVVESLIADGFSIDLDYAFSYGACVMRRGAQTVALTGDKPEREERHPTRLSNPARDACLIVVGDGTVPDVVSALLDGADAYLRKPINYRELLSRVRALFRRLESGMAHGPNSQRAADLKSVLPQSAWKSLTSTEARLLGYLVERKERLVAHDELMQAVWGRNVDKGRLRYYVHSLRKKLGEGTSLRVKTQSGLGYLLVDSDLPVN